MNGMNGTNGTSVGAKLLWKHSSPKSTPMYQFLQEVNSTYGLQLSTYSELHQWSIENIDQFWQRVWEFVGVRAQGKAARVRHYLVPPEFLMLIEY
jgi:acetoacetyl-CoA synthetase